MAHYGVLVRIENCETYEEAWSILKDFAYAHSSDGVVRNTNVPMSPEVFLQLLKDYNIDNTEDYTVEQLRLLLECGTDIKSIIDIKALQNIFEHSEYNINSGKFIDSNGFCKNDSISKLIANRLHTDINIREVFNRNTPESITIYFSDISFGSGLILLKLTMYIGYEDWDYAYPVERWGGVTAGKIDEVKSSWSNDTFYAYGYAYDDSVYSDMTEPPEGFFDNADDKTYFMILNMHI